MLIDDDFAAVGTANLDNRSFRLYFEITVVSTGRGLVEAVADMFTDDFSHCTEVDLKDLREKPYWFQVLVRLARLLAPIQ